MNVTIKRAQGQTCLGMPSVSNLRDAGAKKLGAYLVLGLLFLMSGCTQEPLPDPVDPTPDGKVRVGIFTNINNYQQPTSRFADETSVSGTGRMPWVFVFKGTGATATFAEAKQSVLDGTDTYVTLSLQSSAVEVLVLANAPAYFYNGSADVAFDEANLTAALSGKDLSQATALLRTVNATASAIPYDGGYLPMVGGTQLAKIESTVSIGTSGAKLALKRIVAKVTVSTTATNFAITNWTLAGAKQNTLFFDETVVTGGLMNYTENLTTGGESAPAYTYASLSGETSIIVKGVYNSATHYYKLVFKNKADGSILAVERNKWYKVAIEQVTLAGYTSLAAAIAGTPSNGIMASISVTDLTSFDITDNGQYYLGASNTQLLFYGFPTGSDLPYTVTTIQTNATAAMAGGVNSVTLTAVTPTGSIALVGGSPQSLTLSTDGTTPGVTDINLATVNAATFTSANIVIKLGNLQQTIEVRKVSGVLSYSGGATQLNYQPGVYTTAELVNPSTPSWFTLSTDGTNDVGASYTQPNAASLTPVYLKTESNIAASGLSARSREVFLSRAAQGRVKAFIRQNALNMGELPEGLPTNITTYVGAFWRASQHGERVIKIDVGPSANNNHGTWAATVYWMDDSKWNAGDIVLAKDGSDDFNIYQDPGLVPGDAEDYLVPGNATTITGTAAADGSILFRIGLTSTWSAYDENTNPARYAVVLLSYANDTKQQKIYLRQGEGPDNLIAGGARWSPYNMREANNAIVPTLLTTANAVFTEYPTQAGHSFKWNSLTAIPTVGYTSAEYSSIAYNSGTTYNTANDPCRMISGGRYKTPAPIYNTLIGWELPVTDVAAMWGYYADGWFDRRAIVTSISGHPNTATAYDIGGTSGYIGLLHVGIDNKSNFFTATCGNDRYGAIHGAWGRSGSYWSDLRLAGVSAAIYAIRIYAPYGGSATLTHIEQSGMMKCNYY